ncbi:MAG: amino acid adenylation domain-containing protein [Saprospiraceae bacterium]
MKDSNNKYLQNEYFELTKSQSQIWTGQQLSPDSPLYNMAFTFEFHGEIDIDLFRDAFQLLLEQSDAMRTAFHLIEEAPKQKIYDDFSYDFPYLDFSKKENNETVLQEFVATRSQIIFDISKRLFDAVLIKMSDQYFVWYFNQHHLITDGWSVTIQYNTILDFYKRLQKGEKIIENHLPKFVDFIQFEKEKREAEVSKNTHVYWNNNINTSADSVSFLGKNNDRFQSHTNRTNIILSKEKSNQLRLLTKESDIVTWSEDLSLFITFSTLLFIYNSKINGQRKQSIGTPVHNRTNADFKRMPGLFIELFPLSVEIKNDDTFVSLFEKVRNEYFNFLKNAKTGASSPALGKTFNVVLNYINTSFSEFGEIPMQSNWLDTGHADPSHFLKLQIHDFNSSGCFHLIFDSNKSVFDAEQHQAIGEGFMFLINSFLENRNQKIEFLTPKESLRLESFNQTKVEFPTDETIVSLFEKQVGKTPEADAIIFENEKLTFNQLNKKSNQLGHFLKNKNVEIEDLIVICLDRQLEMMIGLLGILKAGAAYVPLDPTYPEARINLLLEDTQSKIILTTKKYAPHFSNQKDIQIILLDDDWDAISDFAEANLDLAILPQNLMYMIYTSGSTGQPKGVMNQHDGLVNRLLWAQDQFQLKQKSDVILQKTTYSFDVSVWELFWPLITGVKLVFAKPDGHKDSTYLKEIIEKEKITTLHFVPSMLEVFLLDVQVGDCPSLQRILCSGEELKPLHASECYKKIPHIELHNLYGPTEAAIDVTHWEVPKNKVINKVPIGKPVANTQLFILNKLGKKCLIGVQGELYISGIQVARGYHNRSELNQEKFIENPFLSEDNFKVYKTGDLARWLPDSNKKILGRIDSQVKIRGFRIELGEIETIILKNPAIRQCIVIANSNQHGNNQLVAYFVSNQIVEINSIRQFLNHHLPDYMVPAYFLQIEEIPTTINGKVDRKALPPLVKNNTITKPIQEEELNEFQEIIHEIWREVLPQNRISIYDNFFEIGGDSLIAIRMIVRINNAFELELPVNLVFEKPTVSQISIHVEELITMLLQELENENSD